jgi:hypothetical protein
MASVEGTVEQKLEPVQSERLLFFRNTPVLRILLVAAILLLGFGVRLIDLSDPPLDFAPTRQLRSLIIARGYYDALNVPSTRAMAPEDRNFDIQAGQAESVIEPTILEHLSAYTYALLGREDFRIPRLWSILFWVLGGIPLWLLSRKLIGETGALAALAFYEFVPYGIISSRAIQPDPLMVAVICSALYAQVRWSEKDTLARAILAGTATGLAVYVKATAVFFVGIPFLWLVFSGGFLKGLRNSRVYLMAFLALVPAIAFTLWNAIQGGNAGAMFGSRFFISLYLQPHWYQSWFMNAKAMVGYFPLFLGVLAIFLFHDKRKRAWYISLWVAYLLLGIVFSYHIYTHDYYSMPLIPIVAIGFGLFVSLIMERIQLENPGWLAKAIVLGVLAFACALSLLKARTDLLAANYQYEITYWKNLGNKLGRNSKVIALTHDYGYRLEYWGYLKPTLWQTSGDITVSDLAGQQQTPFLQEFKDKTEGKDFFLVTLINDFNSQNQLHDYLFAHYPVEEGEGYLVFDLQHPN